MNPPRIMIVEDEAVTAILLGDLLTDMGYDVCAIEPTEAGAVEAAARCQPDVMIVDVWLGNGNGVSAVEQILRTKFVPHVFVSGDAARVQQIWPDIQVLQRPVRGPDFALAIQRSLGSATAS